MPERHNVVACLGGEETALEARSVPVPAAGEILLGLRVVGFCGTDLFKLKTGSAARSSVLGHELVGDVLCTGAGVDEFAAGDRVVVPHHVPCGTCVYCRRGSETMCETFRENLMEPGGFADRILIRDRAVQHAARKLPDHVTDESAVFLEPAACVLRGIDRSGLTGDGTAVIVGCGSMGLLHLLVAKAALPGVTIVAIDPAPERRAIALELGADSAAAPGDESTRAVSDAGCDQGADVVFDTVGGSQTLAAGLGLTRLGGTIVLFAHAPPQTSAGFDLNELFKGERRVIATYSGALEEQARIFELICSGALDATPLVTHVMPLDDFEQGVALVTAQKALKVLFTPSRSTGA